MARHRLAKVFWLTGHLIASVGCWIKGGHLDIATERYCAICGRLKVNKLPRFEVKSDG